MKHSKKVNNRLELGEFLSKLFLAVAAVCVVALGSVPTASADDPFNQPIALTESGFVIGTTTKGVNEFLGIPYAAPPLRALRWTPPKAYGKFHRPFQATQFGSECPQFNVTLGMPVGSENCLFLNVYTPKHADGWGLPVMFWIHGGGLTTGGGDVYDPTRLVKKGVIVVTINYRLGLLGFFAQSALDAEGHLNANYGLMDQQFALKWVRRNIEAFGGDPRRVTIFGESAGGESVQANLASPTAAGLFQRPIAESGSYFDFQDYLVPIVTVAQGETTGSQFVPAGDLWADFVGCSSQTAACLRGVPASTLVGVYFLGSIFPFVDGTILTQTLEIAFASGQFNHVPVISGGNHDEWRLFVADEYDFSLNPLTNAEYANAVAALETAATPVSCPTW